jgi:hypothetical protein
MAQRAIEIRLLFSEWVLQYKMISPQFAIPERKIPVWAAFKETDIRSKILIEMFSAYICFPH